MQYKKLWIAMGLVMLISFAVLGSVGYKAINNAPPIPSNPPADRKLAPSGDTAPTSLPTGVLTIFTASR